MQETLEQLPAPAQVGKTKVGGIDFNKGRMRWVAQAVVALSLLPDDFIAPQLDEQVRRLSQQDQFQYRSGCAAYDLKKLRGKQIVCRIGKTARYEAIPRGARAMAAHLVLRDKAIKPLLAPAQEHGRSRTPQNPIDVHYQTIRASMRVFHKPRIAA